MTGRQRMIMASMAVAAFLVGLVSLPPASQAAHCTPGEVSVALTELGDASIDVEHSALHSELAARGVLQSGIHVGGDQEIASRHGYAFDEPTCSFYDPAEGPPTSTTSSTTTTARPPQGHFADDEGSVFESDVDWLAAEGITSGCNPPINDRFCPDDLVSRGEMAAFLVRALDLDGKIGDPFVDDDRSVFEDDIERLASAEVTRGCNPPANDRYCPADSVTRAQMAAFLVRAYGLPPSEHPDVFVDDDETVFEIDIAKLASAGVTKGCNPPTNDRFCPHEFVTRAEMAAFLHRATG